MKDYVRKMSMEFGDIWVDTICETMHHDGIPHFKIWCRTEFDLDVNAKTLVRCPSWLGPELHKQFDRYEDTAA
jgi:hypothetical protein